MKILLNFVNFDIYAGSIAQFEADERHYQIKYIPEVNI